MITMSDLKKDLDEYLLLQSDQKKSFKVQLPSIQKPTFRNWFRRDEPNEPTSWSQEAQKDCCISLTRFQRLTGFAVCIFIGCLCFLLSLMYIPVLLLKARKFALLFTLGSLFLILSMFFLWGPIAYCKQMFSRDRLLQTVVYVTTLLATLYFAIHLQSTPLTVLGAVGQGFTFVWTVTSNFPGGSLGVKMFSKLFTKSVGNTLPI